MIWLVKGHAALPFLQFDTLRWGPPWRAPIWHVLCQYDMTSCVKWQTVVLASGPRDHLLCLMTIGSLKTFRCTCPPQCILDMESILCLIYWILGGNTVSGRFLGRDGDAKSDVSQEVS